MRVLGIVYGDREYEAGMPPKPELLAEMGKLREEISKAGVLVATEGLLPSSSGKRVHLEKGKFTVVDGPFTESKELIASYALFEVDSMDEAVEWTRRFLNVLGEGHCELRPVMSY